MLAASLQEIDQGTKVSSIEHFQHSVEPTDVVRIKLRYARFKVGSTLRNHAAPSIGHGGCEPFPKPILIRAHRVEVGGLPLRSREAVAMVDEPNILVPAEQQISVMSVDVSNPGIKSVKPTETVPLSKP